VLSSVMRRVCLSNSKVEPQDSHLTVFTPPPLGTVRMVPKKEVATTPQLGHGPCSHKDTTWCYYNKCLYNLSFLGS
jgi:hypothetical protein